MTLKASCQFCIHVCSPGHLRPAPSKGGWHWPLACGCSRSLCCGERSSLWGLDWTCRASLCSPAERPTANTVNLLVMSHMPFCSSVHKALCDIYNCGCVSVWVWPHFDMPMTKLLCGWMTRHARHCSAPHQKTLKPEEQLVQNSCGRPTAAQEWPWTIANIVLIDMLSIWASIHVKKMLKMIQGCEITYSRACDNVHRSFWVHIRLLSAPIAHLKRKTQQVSFTDRKQRQ